MLICLVFNHPQFEAFNEYSFIVTCTWAEKMKNKKKKELIQLTFSSFLLNNGVKIFAKNSKMS